jgi:hypothetical protein
VFQNRLLRRIFGPATEEMAEGWTKLQNAELHNFYTSPNIIRVIKLRMMSWAVYVALMGEMRNPYKILFRKPKAKILFGRPWR